MNEKNDKGQITLKPYLIALPFIAMAVFVDQLSKWLAVEYLKGSGSFSIIEGVFSLRYLENRGAAFGIFYGQQVFLILIAVILASVILYLYGRIPSGRRYNFLRVVHILIISGAIGNLIDRIRFGFVIDFFFFELINFPIFNVADSYIVIACILLLLLVLFYYKDNELEYLEKREKVMIIEQVDINEE